MSQELYNGVDEVIKAVNDISSDDLYSMASSSFSNFTERFDHLQVFFGIFDLRTACPGNKIGQQKKYSALKEAAFFTLSQQTSKSRYKIALWNNY